MNISFDPSDLKPLVETVVAEAIERIESDQARLGGRLAYPEPEAAALLGIAPHVLRDARLRGEVKAQKIGKRFIYPRSELLRLIGDNHGAKN